ncbi:GRAS transcription factor [Parasponia andersonii]|uniref:GRAS transcription factor n=1 Tax=Parasponia andersonii TaxID=3476 RepID=A0A2P5BEF0_PARAD|nr:GRAS transcription factor [Parasponia andersonii]
MLMGSFNSSHHEQRQVGQGDEEEEQEEDQLEQAAAAPSDLEIHRHQQQQVQASHSQAFPAAATSPPINAIHMRQLVIRCSELMSQSDLGGAQRLVSVLSANSSSYGDSVERLLHQLARALFRRLHHLMQQHHHHHSSSSIISISNNITDQDYDNHDVQALHSCYLTLNQITPFIRFCHLTANQAILEVIDETHQQALHILDFDIMHGLQWPPFMQALVERHPTLRLRITATGTDLSLLSRTGDRLLRFAQSLGLRFQFHPLLLPAATHDRDHLLINSININIPSTLEPDEALAVNCALYLHRLLKDDDDDCIRYFLRSIKALNPKVVTIAEREANHTLADVLDHYTAIFDSLEATLPPNSRERLAVEQVWLGREIMEVVGSEHMVRRYEWWQVMLRSCGFSNVPLSPFALSQAKLLLRLHYPSEGYQLHILNDSFFLGWRNRPLFSVSSWH